MFHLSPSITSQSSRHLRTTILLLILLLSFLLTPISTLATDDIPPAQAPKLQTVKLALNWLPEPEFGGIYAAEIAGIFQKYGLKVQIISGGPDVPTLDMTARGQVDFGIAAADEIVKARIQDRPIKAIYATFQTNPQAVMAHPGNFFSLQELWKSPNTTLALQNGLPYINWLKKQYGPPSAKLVSYAGGIELFIARQDYAQQCFVFAEPVTAKLKGVPAQVFLVASTGFDPYAGVIITRDKLIQQNPKLVQNMILALREGWQTYIDNPAPANAKIARLNKSMSPDTLAAATQAQRSYLENPDSQSYGLGTMSTHRWQTLIDQLIEIDPSTPKEQIPSPADCAYQLINPNSASTPTSP